MMNMKVSNYIEDVKKKIEEKKIFHDPITGKEYKIKKWMHVKSSLADYEALIIEGGYLRGVRGVTYIIKKKSGFGLKFQTKFIISIIYPGDIRDTAALKEKILDKIKPEPEVSYIFCFPSLKGWKGEAPVSARSAYVLVDLKNNSIYSIDNRIKKEYASIFVPSISKAEKILSNTEERVKEYIGTHGKLYYSAEEVSKGMGISMADVEKAFLSLEKEHFFGGTVERIRGKVNFNLFSYVEEKDEEHIGFFERILNKKENADDSDIDRYKKEINSMYIEYDERIREIEDFLGFLDELYKKARAEKNSREAVEITRTKERAQKELKRLEKTMYRIDRLRDGFISMRKEKIPEKIMEKVPVGEKYVTEEERRIRREKEFLEILWDIGLTEEEEEKLRKECISAGWWQDGMPVNIPCPECGEPAVYSLDIDVQGTKKKIYYCDNCGHVWK